MGEKIALTPDRLIDLDHFKVSKIPAKTRPLYIKQRDFHRNLLKQNDGSWNRHLSALNFLKNGAESLMHSAQKVSKDLARRPEAARLPSQRIGEREIRSLVFELEDNDQIKSILNPIDRELYSRSFEIMKSSLKRKSGEEVDLTALKLGRFLKSLHAKYMQPLRDLSLEKNTGIKPRYEQKENIRAMSIAPRDLKKPAA
jgi:hypothetical protein